MKKLAKIFSWRNLGILRYNAIWQNLAALFYIGFTEDLFSGKFLLRVLAFGIFSTFMTGYGYLINDFADRELDRQHGKPNAFQDATQIQAVLIILAVLLVGGLFSYPFWNRTQFWVIWLLWTLVATFYSLPPLRLKERGGWGLATTIMGQQSFPTALLFAAFGNLWSLGALGFIFFATSRGTSSDVSHQMRDFENDSQTNTRTFAVRQGISPTQKLYAASLEIERLALGMILVIMFVGVFWDSRDFFPPLTLGTLDFSIAIFATVSMWLLILIYLGLLTLTVGRSWRANKSGSLTENDPYNEERQAKTRDALHIIHHSFPSVVLPLFLAVMATLVYWPNIIFLFAVFFLYGLHNPRQWQVFLPSKFRNTG